jgi:hypothetical protein
VNSYVGIYSGVASTSALGTPQFVVSNNNYVGIGTTNPVYPLQVSGNNPGAVGSVYYYFNSNRSATGTFNSYAANGSQSGGTGLYVAAAILSGTEIAVISDERFKKNVIDISQNYAIEVIRKLRPVTFNYIDHSSGEELQSGFIAQDVIKVLPDAVAVNHSEYTPNIYEIVNISSGNIVTLNIKSTSDISLCDASTKFKFYDHSNNEIIKTVGAIIDDKNFTVIEPFSDTDLSENQIFAFGQYITNGLTVTKADIFTHGIAAIKLLDNQLVSANTTIQTQQSQIQELQTKNTDLESRLAAIEARLTTAGF